MKKLLVTGGSGLLGSKIACLGMKNFEVVATCNRNPVKTDYALIPLDITQKEAVMREIQKIRPDYVIHTAALTDVDYCEDHRKEAREINVDGTRNVAFACRELGIRMIYVSTDAVFDGKKGLYRENDPVNPVNYYGRTKLEGERAIERLDLDYTVARISVLYGWNVKERLNFVTWLIKELKAGNNVNIFVDQWNSPTFADNCAAMLLKLMEKGSQGIYHASGKERISRFDFALKIAAAFKLDKGLIKPVYSSDFRQKAKRASDSSLDVSKIEKELKTKPFDVVQGLSHMRKQFKFKIE